MVSKFKVATTFLSAPSFLNLSELALDTDVTRLFFKNYLSENKNSSPPKLLLLTALTLYVHSDLNRRTSGRKLGTCLQSGAPSPPPPRNEACVTSDTCSATMLSDAVLRVSQG
jgi:hypothetical protein